MFLSLKGNRSYNFLMITLSTTQRQVIFLFFEILASFPLFVWEFNL